MRIFTALLVAGALSVGAFGADSDLKVNMKKLDETTAKVENAFNTGDTVGIVALAKDLGEQNRALFSNSDKVKNMLPAGKEKFANTAMNFSTNMNKANTAMIDSLEAKNFGKAQKEFMKVKQACMNCHALVRDWGK